MNSRQKLAVITGGSRGIGFAIAEVLAKEEYDILLVARNGHELTLAKNKLNEYGVRIETCSADVSQENEVSKVVSIIRGKFGGRVDALVNAAGVYGPIGPVTEVDPTEWRQAVDINLFGTFLMIHTIAPFMKKQKYGKIINFSGGGESAYPNFTSYAAAKGGVVRLTETVAVELKDFNISVNAIAPGGVNTKFLDDLLAAGSEKVGQETYRRSLEQKETGGISPQKCANLVVFLVSEAANGLSGKLLSAVHDNYTEFPARIKEIMNSDVYTMRRIKPSDRGMKL